MIRLSIRVAIAALAVAAMMVGCGDNGGSPAGPQSSRVASTSLQIDCGGVGYLSHLSPVLPAWQDSIEAWLGNTDLLDDPPAWMEESTVDGYLGELVPVLQQWQPAINDALAASLLDSVADYDPAGSSNDYLAGLSSLLVAWQDSLNAARGVAFLPDLPAFTADDTAPVIACVADTSIGCAGEEGVVVEFDVTAADDCDPAPVVSCEPASGSIFPVGDTEVVCTAVDFSGNTSTCTFTVTVATDTDPPVVRSVTASPDMLWPPNHKWVEVRVFVDAVDNCDESLSCTILEVTSNEAGNGTGDGNTEPDWMITGDTTLKLRAERSGGGDGRIYSVRVRCEDSSGNGDEHTVTVTVPHDQSGK
ncbi:MAG: HYR domain-containing protein [Candidatus Krumholzibacteria bacterium]|nr:HYR domain-containing protein [Candidatus Krumholzibacteria bacterium]MDH4337255.1 HYR domain-containing protein [Candidatus Krumholzibacteria bacterium]MDH5268717.1 HYR domain-containing protein [Candidatus Krumholzibacteria bacterium]MDH5627174.1 HYR domain-containing protein [Candidatus Krumholzibacteria bacterium]